MSSGINVVLKNAANTISLQNFPGNQIQLGSNSYFNILTANSINTSNIISNSSINITSGIDKWCFANSGVIIFPDNTVQTTAYTGIANSATYLNGFTSSYFAANSSLANYYLASNPAGYITASANITGSANSATYLGGKTEANLNVNAAIYSTNSTFSYTANSATYLGGFTSSYFAANSSLANYYLASNPAGYITASSSITGSANSATYLNGFQSSYFAANSSLANYYLASNPAGYITASASITGSANSAAYLGGKTEANLNVNSAVYATNSSFAYTANNATYFGGLTSDAYQTKAGLNANIAAYLPVYGGVVNASVVNIYSNVAFAAGSSGSNGIQTSTFAGNPYATTSDTYYLPITLGGGGVVYIDNDGNFNLWNTTGSSDSNTSIQTVVLDTIPSIVSPICQPITIGMVTPKAGILPGSLPHNTTYYFKVVGIDSFGNPTLPSQEVSFNTGAGTSIDIYWSVSYPQALSSYQVWFSTTSGGQNKYISVSAYAYSGVYSFRQTTGATSGTLPTTNRTSSIQLSTIIPTNANTSLPAWGTYGAGIVIANATYTDTTTASNAVISSTYMNNFETPTYSALNSNITITNLFGTYFANPANGSTVKVTNKYAVGVDSFYSAGNSLFSGTIASSSNIQIGTISSTSNGSSLTTNTIQIGNTSIYSNISPGVLYVNSVGTTIPSSNASVGANGSTQLTNGIVMKWGSLLVNSTTSAQTFYTPYTVNAFSFTAVASTTGATYVPAVTTLSKTGYTILTSNSANTTVYWTAIGI